ncbi:MAG: hypothetical protein QNK05_22895, partial [Myxococcota bacterium]|nr:hypothetical protein [Myxococcota bacterium]
MSVRAKVLALLLGLLVFLVATASVSIGVRARAEEALSRVTQRDVPLLALSTRVTAVHLEQALRLERALRAAERDGPDSRAVLLETRRAFESDAASIWNRLQDATAFAESAAEAGDPDARHRLEGVMRIDQVHNEYAEQAREAFDAIASGDRRAALVAVEQAEEAKVALGLVLGEVLEDSARSADDASSLARRDS